MTNEEYVHAKFKNSMTKCSLVIGLKSFLCLRPWWPLHLYYWPQNYLGSSGSLHIPLRQHVKVTIKACIHNYRKSFNFNDIASKQSRLVDQGLTVMVIVEFCMQNYTNNLNSMEVGQITMKMIKYDLSNMISHS